MFKKEIKMAKITIEENGNLFAFENKKKKDDDKESLPVVLKKAKDLEFLEDKKIENIFEKDHWSLHHSENPMKPLEFSNGKTQEDIVREIVHAVKAGKKAIFLHGACGTGKSAIALNVARVLGKTSIVVPVKALQRQYEEDYFNKKYLIKNGKKLKIAMITGRENHDSVINPGVSCADPNLPENIKITEKNYHQLIEFYEENPFIKNKERIPLKNIRRISVAPANPYWSPIYSADFELNQFSDAKKKRYKAIGGKEYIFYYRKPGCSYYDQYLSYINSDVIIFNSAKYLSEFFIGRKPETEVEIIDEADDFLDGLFQQAEINVTRLIASLKNIYPESINAMNARNKIVELLELEEKNKRILGIDEKKVFHIKDTKIKDVLSLMLANLDLEAEISLDEMNYSNKLVETANSFKDILNEVYLMFKREEENLIAYLVSSNLSYTIQQIIEKNKAVVFMSGTLHSERVLKNVFKIQDYQVIEAETLNPGNVEVMKTGKEFDCKYSNFNMKKNSREEYLGALHLALKKAEKPILVHVNAFQDLPSEEEKEKFKLDGIMSSERLRSIQSEDKTGRSISLFKQGLSDCLFSTKCARGVDFPGDTCKSVIFTKYPNPNVAEPFWKILEKTHPEYFWDFYKDKARREFLQRIYRAVRSKDDHVFVLSPDLRVLNAVIEMHKTK